MNVSSPETIIVTPSSEEKMQRVGTIMHVKTLRNELGCTLIINDTLEKETAHNPEHLHVVLLAGWRKIAWTRCNKLMPQNGSRKISMYECTEIGEKATRQIFDPQTSS